MTRTTIRDNQVMERKARQVKLLLANCDGVLTDGSFYLLEDGLELKKFSRRDVIAVERLKSLADTDVVLISESNEISFLRLAEKLKITEHHLGLKNKESILNVLLEKYQLKPEQVAYIGDEISDVELMNMVGLSACPLDAAYEARCAADYVCNSCGGNGVLREFAEFIIMVRQKEKCLAD